MQKYQTGTKFANESGEIVAAVQGFHPAPDKEDTSDYYDIWLAETNETRHYTPDEADMFLSDLEEYKIKKPAPGTIPQAPELKTDTDNHSNEQGEESDKVFFGNGRNY